MRLLSLAAAVLILVACGTTEKLVVATPTPGYSSGEAIALVQEWLDTKSLVPPKSRYRVNCRRYALENTNSWLTKKSSDYWQVEAVGTEFHGAWNVHPSGLIETVHAVKGGC